MAIHASIGAAWRRAGHCDGKSCFPSAQIPFSALLALPFRANIPVAVAMTFITNPLTTPFIWVAAFWIGRWILHYDAQVGNPLAEQVVANATWLHWFVAEAGPSTIIGLVVITAVLAVVGFFASALGWRWWIGRKWRQRRQ